MYNDDQDLSEQEVSAFAALSRELAPGDLLEERVVRALRKEGYFGVQAKTSNRWIRAAVGAAAAVALFAGGVATGRNIMASSASASAAQAVAPSDILREANREPPLQRPQSRERVTSGRKAVAEREMWL
jgi:hypothetical protein